jgi:FAD/FMN-containing dehydrogenase
MSVSADVLDQIKNLLGQGGYLDQPTDMQPYLTSWRNGWTGKAPLIALPNSTEQVSALVTFCHKNKIALVPQGGNTGLVGGSIPSDKGDQVVINLSRMNKIREIDAVGSNMTVEAGTILQVLQEAAAKAGMLFPLSMASEGSAEIGGAISTNAGGTAVLRYGNMRDLVMGIEAVLPDGQIFNGLKKLAKDNTGYNLGRYFIGAEGTLGIVTAATLKLFPVLQQKLTAVIAIPDAETALELLKDVRQEVAEYLTAFEIMSHAALQLVTKHIADTRFPGKDDAPYYLLIELAATSNAVPLRDIVEGVAMQAFMGGQILDAVLAENETQAKQFWHLREHISEAIRKQGPGIHFDISLPLNQLADFLHKMEPKVKALAPDVIIAPFGHIGDGNLHYNMCFASEPANFAALKEQIKTLVYGEVKARQGSISAEHGIGIERKVELLAYKAPHEIELMKRVKQAFDPENLMNPGKIFD